MICLVGKRSFSLFGRVSPSSFPSSTIAHFLKNPSPKEVKKQAANRCFIQEVTPALCTSSWIKEAAEEGVKIFRDCSPCNPDWPYSARHVSLISWQVMRARTTVGRFANLTQLRCIYTHRSWENSFKLHCTYELCFAKSTTFFNNSKWHGYNLSKCDKLL